MKCLECGRDYYGKECPYCGAGEEKIVKKGSKTLFLLAILGLGSAVVSFTVPIFIIITLIIISLIGYYLKRDNKESKIIFLEMLIIVLTIISTFSFLTPYYDKYFGYKKIEKTLEIDLPNGKCIEYEYENGFDNNISYTYYKYSISKEQYEKIVEKNLSPFHEYDWFINIVSDKNLPYLIYNHLDESFSAPNNKLNYYYMFIQVEKEGNEYFGYIYNVQRRKY